MKAASCHLIVFAKAPLAGLSKTRLIPALGAAGAAALAERLLDHAVSAGMSAGFAEVELCVTPDASHPAFARLAVRHEGLQLIEQGAGDLGERMHRALARRLSLGRRVLLIGTDAPALDVETLQAAAEAMIHHDAVFIPALDGGYALVGLSRLHADLFTGISWGTPLVMAATRERARQAGLRWFELAPVADIDEPADLVYLPPGWLP